MCKMFMAAGQFDFTDIGKRRLLHRFLTALFKSTNYDRMDQDAAGFYAWSGDRERLSKKGINATDFVDSDREWGLLEQNPAKLYLCHARGAMSNTTPPDNNHPFKGEHNVLMHEGWISNYKDLARQQGLKLETETDSEFYMRFADTMRDAFAYEEWSPSKCMNALMRFTSEPTALAFINRSNRFPSIWFAKNEHAEHKFIVFRIPFFNGIFIVSDEAMMTIAGDLTFDRPHDFIRAVTVPEPFEIFKISNRTDIVETFNV